MFTLCIPTMDRFDNFLSEYLVKYLDNPYISEIVITDENGNDIEKIKHNFPESKKLVLIKNDYRLGPFLNKIKACSAAKNEWIALIDSDNFAHFHYFEIAKQYIENNIKDEKNIILSPCKAMPNFDYSHLSGFIFTNGTFEENRKKEKQLIKSNNVNSETLFNTGNYIINKFLIENLNINIEINSITRSSACDVMYLNVLLFENLDLKFHVVPNLEYKHVVHNNSIYILTRYNHEDINNNIRERFYNLK